jgi:hypothetical protein
VNANLIAFQTAALEWRQADKAYVRAQTQALSDNIGRLRSEVADSQEHDRRVTTKAMRWQVIGLGTALAGALLTAIGH